MKKIALMFCLNLLIVVSASGFIFQSSQDIFDLGTVPYQDSSKPWRQPLRLMTEETPPALGWAENKSYETSCAEEDNVNIPIFRKGVQQFRITATHPAYEFGQDNSLPNFAGCEWCNSVPPIGKIGSSIIYDDGINIVEARTDSNWWRGLSMKIVAGEEIRYAHHLVLYRKVEGENSWTQFLVLYQDGSMVLKPHPKAGHEDNKFGASVVIGPASVTIDPITERERYYADIEEVIVNPDTLSLDIKYKNGGSAHINLSVDRNQTVADVKVDYDTAESPFVTLRSMYVTEDNSDVARIKSLEGDFPILGNWASLAGRWWFFYRPTFSKHNTSAPNIMIEVLN